MGREPSGMLRRLVIGIVCICACTGFRGNPPLCILCLCLAFQCLIMMTACGELRAFVGGGSGSLHLLLPIYQFGKEIHAVESPDALLP